MGDPSEEGSPDYLLNFKSSAFFDFLCCFRQCQSENAVLIGSGDLIAVDTVEIKASCEGAVRTLSSEIIVLFVLFLIFKKE